MFRSVRTNIIVAFIVALAAIVAIASVAGWVYIRWYEHQVSDRMGVSAASECAEVAGYMMEDLDVSAPDSKTYQDYRKLLRGICKEKGMDYLYVFKCDTEAKTMTYLICVADDDANDERIASDRGFGTIVTGEIPDTMRHALNGETVYQADEINNEYGNVLAWYSQVPGGDGTTLAGADYAVTDQRSRVFVSVVSVIGPLVLGLLVLLMVQMHVLNKRIFRPLQTITERMRTFSADRASQFEPLGIKTHDEMGAIADAFEGMAADIGAYVNDIEHLTAERVQADVELDVARRIQLGMVPERTELKGPGFEALASSQAARSVGGDFYDVFELEDGCIGAVVGDVSGKGVAAALFMAMTKTMVHDGLASGGGPADVLDRVNDRLCASNPEGMFVTVFAFVLDYTTGEVRYANAGHLPPLVVGSDVRQVEAEPGVLLGLFEDAGLKEATLHIGENESLLVFTDGVTEAVSAERTFFGDEGLMNCVSKGVPYRSAAGLAETVVDAVEEFSAGCEQFDDLTLVVTRRVPRETHESHETREPRESGAPPELRALPVEIASFASVRDAILAKADDDAAGRKACLACEEAFVNIVSYSGATAVWYSVDNEDNCLRVTFADDGVPFDPFASDPGERPFESLDTGGMGIGLIRDLSHQASYERADGRNVLVLSF